MAAVLLILRRQQLAPHVMRGCARFGQTGVAIEADPPQCRPVLDVVVDENGDRWVQADVVESAEIRVDLALASSTAL